MGLDTAKKLLSSALLFLVLSTGAAQAAPMLLEGFEYGASKSAVEAMPGAMKGEDAFKNDVFFKGMTWCGASWSAQCSFIKDKLEGITLYAPYSAELLRKVSGKLKEDKFQLLGLVVDDKALDIITLARIGGQEAFQKRFRELTSAKVPQRISYEWFDSKKVGEEQLANAASLSQLLTLADMEIMQVEVTQSADGEKLENRMLAVHFSYPVMNVLQD